MKTIGVAISSQGRTTLIDTLHSIMQQGLIEGDRIIVAFDGEPQFGTSAETFSKMFPRVEFVVRAADPGAWGHTQTNQTFDELHNTVDFITAQDDDDIFAPRAFEMMRQHGAMWPDHLLMSRAYNHAWGLLWRRRDWDEELVPGDQAYAGNMAHDGHSLWIPGHAPRLPKLGRPYNGDQEFIQAARLLFWEKVRWCQEVTSITRPSHTFKWKLGYWRVETPKQLETLRVLRNECREGMTGFTGVIDPLMQKTWWETNKDVVRAFLLQDGPVAVGFVVIRPEGKNQQTATIGVGKKYRRQGYGREIAQFAVLAAQGPLVGTAYANNPVLPLDYEAGWVKTGEHDGLVDLECAWPPRFLLAKR